MTPAPEAVARQAADPSRRPVGPRRVSGPARRPVPLDPAVLPAPPRRLIRLVDHALLDRLIRGRTWIGIVAFALIGIVAMQVALLDLNAGIGRLVARAASLQRENSVLTMQVSTLRAVELRDAGAGRGGMVYAPAGDVRYLTVGRGDPAQAAASITPPKPPPGSQAGGVSAGAGGQPSQTADASRPGALAGGQTAGGNGGAASAGPVH